MVDKKDVEREYIKGHFKMNNKRMKTPSKR